MRIYSGRSSELFEIFREIYNATMDKDNASDYYYFAPSFYESVCKDLPHNSQIFYAQLPDGTIIASSIMLWANRRMNYHLSGSRREYQSLAPTNLLLYEAALWGCEAGCKTLHLGGGVGSGEDSLFAFKKSFFRGDHAAIISGGRFLMRRNIPCSAPCAAAFPTAAFSPVIGRKPQKRELSMKTNIWILNHYASDMYFDCGGRHYNFAKYLRRAGYAPVIFCANSKHGKPECFLETDALWEERIAEEIDTPFVFVRARTYTGNGKQRVLNMIDFYRNVKKAAKEYAAQHGKPDVIFASSVHPLTLVAGIQLAKQFGVKCVCEVRDLWPESIVVYSNRFTKDNPLIKLLYRGEKWIYRKADALVFTMEAAYDYIVERGWEKDITRSKVYYINNGVDLEQFDYNKEHFRVDDPDLDDPNTFKVVYTGSIRKVNNLGLLLDAAKCVNNPRVKFLIWGDGDERETLERRVRDEGLSNVVFKGKVEKKYIPSIVSRANLNFAHNSFTYLFNYGISFNKLFDYFAAGQPILCDFPCRYNPAIIYGAGIEVRDTQPQEIAAVIGQLSELPAEQRRLMGANAAAPRRTTTSSA